MDYNSFLVEERYYYKNIYINLYPQKCNLLFILRS
jgi:hypothetical protein